MNCDRDQLTLDGSLMQCTKRQVFLGELLYSFISRYIYFDVSQTLD